MNKMRPILGIIIVIILFIVLNDAVVYAIANITSLGRKSNEKELYETAYKEKIERLEKTIFDFEKAQNNLKIYEGDAHILAKIALRDIYDIYDTLVVNTESKVNVGDAVINELGLVGLVKESSKSTAKVSLLSKEENLSILVNGNYGLLGEFDPSKKEFILKNIDNYKNVNVGDEVVTSGFQKIDADFKIGRVTSVEVKGIEKIVRVKPYADFDDLNYLLVVSK